MTESFSLSDDWTLFDVITEVLSLEPPMPQDKAVAALALYYADLIDNDGDITKLGPSLLSALEALQLSPRARAAAKKGMSVQNERPKTGIDELRERRLRKSGT